MDGKEMNMSEVRGLFEQFYNLGKADDKARELIVEMKKYPSNLLAEEYASFYNQRYSTIESSWVYWA